MKSILNTSFSRQHRLNDAQAYRRTFQHAQKLRGRCFRLFWTPTSSEHGGPRLGLAIAKRTVRKAVARNTIKRIIRESFRNHRTNLPAVDIVVLANLAAASEDKAKLRREIDKLWKKLCSTAC